LPSSSDITVATERLNTSHDNPIVIHNPRLQPGTNPR
jgi:hypothetical protein